MPELSVLIPARHELWLRETVADVLAAIRGDTEVIVVLDGAWPLTPIPDHPRLRLVHHSVPIGQRASTNLAARVSQARFVMKLDAHCRVAEGFDVVLRDTARELGPLVTQVPKQYNLHVFDWQCDGCGARTYQGPTPTVCATCQGASFHRELVWQPRLRRVTTRWRFDRDLHFQYWGEGEKRPDAQGDLIETMSCLGACWYLERERYWQLGGLDEAHGSWGQMGTEIGCKAWLSGGRLVTNTKTWFAHMFRTQGGDFGFPYDISGKEQEAARAYSQDLWRHNRWPLQVRPLSWLVEKFAPVPGWYDVPATPAPQRTGIVYYTDNRLDPTIAEACRRQLRRAAGDRPIVCVSLAPVDFGDQRIVLAKARGYLTMFEQILAGLEALDVDTVCLAEHDMLYPAEHLAFVPPRRDTYYYNEHVWKVRQDDGHALTYWCQQTSGLCADRQLLLAHYRARVAKVAAEGYHRNMGFEPGKKVRHGGVDDVPAVSWRSTVPLVDIRHGQNLTPSRWAKEQFRNPRNTAGWTEADAVPGWGQTRGRFDAWLQEVTT